MTPRTTQRTAFIKSATGLFHRQGFRGTGVDQVVTHASGSKGSFYHHFKSKEDLGRSVLDSAAEGVVGSVEQALCNPAIPPVDRLLRMIEVVTAVQEETGYRRGCLLGNLAAELSGTNEALRQHLAGIFSRWTRAIAKTLGEAQERGDLSPDLDPQSMAHFLLCSLEGAILFAKAEREGTALEDCRHYLSMLLGRTPTPAPLREPIV